MIYEILRFKKFPLFLGITVFVSSPIFAWFRFSPGAGQLAGIVGIDQLSWIVGIAFFIYMIVLASEKLPRSTLFEAALPIRARDLFCTRVLFMLALLWTFLLIIISAVQGSGGFTRAIVTAYLCMAGGVGTLAFIVRDSIRAAEFRPPRWGRWPILALVVVLLFLPWPLGMSAIQMASFAATLGLGSAALFLRTWTSFPESFRLAPDKPVKEKSRRSGFASPSTAWRPALSAICDLVMIRWLFLCVIAGAIGLLFFEFLFFFVAFLYTWKRVTVDNRWLFLLPISRKRLFAMTTLVPLAAITMCSLIQLHYFTSLPIAVIVLDGAAVAAVCLLALLIIVLPNFLPQTGSWQMTSLILAALLLPPGWVVYEFLNTPLIRVWKLGSTPFERWVASLAPARLPLLMIAAAVVLPTLYWLAYVGFRRMDITPKRTTATR